ncbi:hypothetical protein M514_27518, partial [Trichuris suis]
WQFIGPVWSEEMRTGTPKRETQWEMKARPQERVDLSEIGMASGHLVNLSTIVRCVLPLDGGSGPTISTWTWSKRRSGGSKFCSGALMWRWILEVWQGTQDLAQILTCLRKPCHMNLAAMSFCVVRIESWARPWTISKMRRPQAAGIMGRGCPVETSQRRVAFVGPKRTSS